MAYSAYPTTAELAAYIGSANDVTQTQNLAAAISFVESWTGRQFIPYSGTELFTYRDHVSRRGQRLMLFRDLLSVTTLTNGDGTVIGSGSYRKIYNARQGSAADASCYALDLLPVAGLAFTDGTVGYMSLLGSWGYHNVEKPPGAIFQAILMIGAQLYRARSGGGGQVTQVQPSGILLAGVDLDQIVIDMLKPFRRGVL